MLIRVLILGKNNARLRRLIDEILFEHGPLSGVEISEMLHSNGLCREVPTERSLTAIVSKNTQIICVGKRKVELTNGLMAKNMMFDIDRGIIKEKGDLIYTRPFSSMTAGDKRRATRCFICKQMRIIEDGEKCVSCLRRV